MPISSIVEQRIQRVTSGLIGAGSTEARESRTDNHGCGLMAHYRINDAGKIRLIKSAAV